MKKEIKKALELSGAFTMNTKIRKYTLELATKLQHKGSNGYWNIDLTNKGILTQTLKEILDQLGCFKFYSTNSGEYIISYHQIHWFLYYGFKWLQKGITVSKETHSLHHKNSNKDENQLSNLVMLTNEDHHYITRVVNESLGLHDFVTEINPDAVRYNNQGHKVKDAEEFLCNILAETLYSTIKFMEKAAQGKGIFAKFAGLAKYTYDWVTTRIKQLTQVKVLAGVEKPTIPYQPEEEWDALTRLAESLMETFGSQFHYTIEEFKKLVGLEFNEPATVAIASTVDANTDNYTLINLDFFSHLGGKNVSDK
jgi:hypothetical protein